MQGARRGRETWRSARAAAKGTWAACWLFGFGGPAPNVHTPVLVSHRQARALRAARKFHSRCAGCGSPRPKTKSLVARMSASRRSRISRSRCSRATRRASFSMLLARRLARVFGAVFFRSSWPRMGRMPCVAPLSRLLGVGQFALLLLAAAVAAVACSVATTPPMQPSATARTRAQAEWALPSALSGGIGQGHGHPCLALGMRCTRSSSLDWLRLRGGAQVAAVAAPVAQQPALGTGGWMPDMELLQIMHDLLEKTLQAGEVERAHGEQGLKQLQQRSGFLPALFTVVGTGAVRIEVRLLRPCTQKISSVRTGTRRRGAAAPGRRSANNRARRRESNRGTARGRERGPGRGFRHQRVRLARGVAHASGAPRGRAEAGALRPLRLTALLCGRCCCRRTWLRRRQRR